MPGTAYFFPKPNRPADHPQTLIAFLSNNPSSLTLARGLEEFAWRSLVDGKRVRAYCAEVSHAIARVSLIRINGTHKDLKLMSSCPRTPQPSLAQPSPLRSCPHSSL
jgi:hypothetical protein